VTHGEDNSFRRDDHSQTTMDRRSFLRNLASAGVFFLAGGAVRARPLFLIGSSSPSQIANVEWFLYETERQQSAGTAQRRCAVRVTSTPGVQGWADFAGSVMPGRDAAGALRDLLLGRSLDEHAAIWRQLYEQGTDLGTLAALDVALWDVRGRLEGKPVHALLGTRRQDVKAFAVTGLNLPGPKDYADYALMCQDKGLHGCKVQPYGASPDRDMAVYQAVREAVGPDFPCMADGLGSYTYDDTLRVGRLLDELAYKWYESPMPETDDWLSRYTMLAAELRTPICAPKTDPDSYPARVRWITAKACDISCMDVLHGGFTACVELASACEAAGIPLHLPDLGPDSYPHLQLIGATEESLIEYMELSSASRETRISPGRLTPDPTFDDDGRVPIPQTPGMGIELDWRYIATHRSA
jgi:L-alanine-DL-glutamate epimerase-like enolase superfamily enzyme